jgi:hypothetical protein
MQWLFTAERSTRRALLPILGALLLPGFSAAASPAAWIQAWYAPPFPPTAVLASNDVRSFGHQTVRQVVRMQAGGQRIRLW